MILAGLIDTKTGKPTRDRGELLGALVSLAEAQVDDAKRAAWKAKRRCPDGREGAAMTDYGYAIDPRPAELGGGWHHSPPFPFRCLGGLLGGLGLVLLPLQRLKLPGKSCGLLAGLCCHLAGLVTLGLRLPDFLRRCCAGGVVGLCSLGGLLLDLLGAVGARLQLGGQHGGLLLGGGAALLCLGQCGA